MSASEYYGSGGHYPPRQPTYAGPQQAQYASGSGHSASYYNSAPPQYQQQPGQDGEKGLMATVVGGAGGGALGHKVGKGSKLKTMLGAVGGAVVANAVENKLKNNNHGHGQGHGHGHHGHHHAPPSHHHGGYHGKPSGLLGAAPVAGLLGAASSHGSPSKLSGLLGGGKPQHGHHGHHGHHHGHHGHHGGW